jgi:RNA polymerase sigma factor (sigma-70 family)
LLSDEQIIRRVIQGHTEDYRELIGRYNAPVYRLAYRILGRHEDAEDATQEVFLRVYQKMDTCRDTSRFWAWVRRITVNLCVRRVPVEDPSDEVVDMVDSSQPMCNTVEVEMLRRVEADAINQAIDALPSPYRTVIVLRHQEDLSYKEIAESLESTVANVQVQLHRARKMLASRLAVVEDGTM